MQTALHRRRSRWARPLSWLVVAGLAGAALIGPGAGGVAASNEPGSPDFVPNSGHTSSSGLTLAMGTATITCDGDTASSFDGSFTFAGNDPGDHVVIYLAANTGSNADPAGNVQNNELTIDLDGKTSPVSFSLPVTSPFTATAGGVLVVFASDVAGTSTYDSKSNSLNCSDSTTTSTSTSTSTSTETTSTSTETTTTETSTESTGTESSTTESTTTESTGTESSTTESTSTESTGTESSTTGSSTTESSTTSTSTGDELGIEGTPGVTPPPTDTVAAPAAPASTDGYRMVLLGLAALLALVLLLQPKEATARR